MSSEILFWSARCIIHRAKKRSGYFSGSPKLVIFHATPGWGILLYLPARLEHTLKNWLNHVCKRKRFENEHVENGRGGMCVRPPP